MTAALLQGAIGQTMTTTGISTCLYQITETIFFTITMVTVVSFESRREMSSPMGLTL